MSYPVSLASVTSGRIDALDQCPSDASDQKIVAQMHFPIVIYRGFHVLQSSHGLLLSWEYWASYHRLMVLWPGSRLDAGLMAALADAGLPVVVVLNK
eukprot:scaffold86975_cov43-Prasinocladus_malaysianus.AAC.1